MVKGKRAFSRSVSAHVITIPIDRNWVSVDESTDSREQNEKEAAPKETRPSSSRLSRFLQTLRRSATPLSLGDEDGRTTSASSTPDSPSLLERKFTRGPGRNANWTPRTDDDSEKRSQFGASEGRQQSSDQDSLFLDHPMQTTPNRKDYEKAQRDELQKRREQEREALRQQEEQELNDYIRMVGREIRQSKVAKENAKESQTTATRPARHKSSDQIDHRDVNIVCEHHDRFEGQRDEGLDRRHPKDVR